MYDREDSVVSPQYSHIVCHVSTLRQFAGVFLMFVFWLCSDYDWLQLTLDHASCWAMQWCDWLHHPGGVVWCDVSTPLQFAVVFLMFVWLCTFMTMFWLWLVALTSNHASSWAMQWCDSLRWHQTTPPPGRCSDVIGCSVVLMQLSFCCWFDVFDWISCVFICFYHLCVSLLSSYRHGSNVRSSTVPSISLCVMLTSV